MKIKEKWKKEGLTILAYAFFAVCICLILKLYVVSNDDLVLSRNVHKDSLLNLTWKRYQSWEGSWLGQSLLIFLVLKYPWSYKILHFCMCFVMTYSLTQIVGCEKNRHIWAVLLFFLFPMGITTTAGTVVTGIAYFWVATCAMYAVTLTIKTIRSKKITKIEYILGTMALVLGSNREQSSILLLIFFTEILCYGWITKTGRKSWGYIYLQWLMTVLNLISIMLAPGLKRKSAQTIAKAYPDFGSISMADKIYEGISETLNYFLTNFQPIVWLLVLLLAYMVFEKCKEFGPRIVAILPVLYLFVVQVKPWSFLTGILGKSRIITIQNVDSLGTYLPMIFQVMWLGILLAEIWFIFENSKEFWILLFALSAGFAATIAIGFTGSIYASGARIYTFFYWDLIAVTIFLLSKAERIRESRVAMLVIAGVSCFCILNYCLALRAWGGDLCPIGLIFISNKYEEMHKWK